MTFIDKDLSIVMQGSVQDCDPRKCVSIMRHLFPRSQLILATQSAHVGRLSDYSMFDQVVLTEDPGPLPAVKFGGQAHNINRQITTTAAGLAYATTRYALKLRTDSFLTSCRIVNFWNAWASASQSGRQVGEGRILITSLYTLNPRYDERLPFHISDWLQFGLTADIKRFWDCPLYDTPTATFYETTQHADGSLPRERQFRARFATEQWLALHYLYRNQQFPIRFHNDCSEEIVRQYERDMIDNFIVVHPHDINLRIPKHERIYKSRYANLRNYSHEDWKVLAKEQLGETRSLAGYSQWPRTQFQKSLYMVLRRKRITGRPELSKTDRAAMPRVTMSRN